MPHLPEDHPPPQVPPVPPPENVGSLEEAEHHFLTESEELDLSLRAWAARGGLLAATVLYAAGLFALTIFLGVFERWPAVDAAKWQIVVTTVVALFTVPTVILLTVIRSSAPSMREPKLDASTTNLHTLLGEKLLGLLEKLANRLISKD